MIHEQIKQLYRDAAYFHLITHGYSDYQAKRKIYKTFND